MALRKVIFSLHGRQRRCRQGAVSVSSVFISSSNRAYHHSSISQSSSFLVSPQQCVHRVNCLQPGLHKSHGVCFGESDVPQVAPSSMFQRFHHTAARRGMLIDENLPGRVNTIVERSPFLSGGVRSAHSAAALKADLQVDPMSEYAEAALVRYLEMVKQANTMEEEAVHLSERMHSDTTLAWESGPSAKENLSSVQLPAPNDGDLCPGVGIAEEELAAKKKPAKSKLSKRKKKLKKAKSKLQGVSSLEGLGVEPSGPGRKEFEFQNTAKILQMCMEQADLEWDPKGQRFIEVPNEYELRLEFVPPMVQPPPHQLCTPEEYLDSLFARVSTITDGVSSGRHMVFLLSDAGLSWAVYHNQKKRHWDILRLVSVTNRIKRMNGKLPKERHIGRDLNQKLLYHEVCKRLVQNDPTDWLKEIAESELLFFSGKTELWNQLYEAQRPKFSIPPSDSRWRRVNFKVDHDVGLSASQKTWKKLCTGSVGYVLEKEPRPLMATPALPADLSTINEEAFALAPDDAWDKADGRLRSTREFKLYVAKREQLAALEMEVQNAEETLRMLQAKLDSGQKLVITEEEMVLQQLSKQDRW